jgi:hypothetical protein
MPFALGCITALNTIDNSMFLPYLGTQVSSPAHTTSFSLPLKTLRNRRFDRDSICSFAPNCIYISHQSMFAEVLE